MEVWRRAVDVGTWRYESVDTVAGGAGDVLDMVLEFVRILTELHGHNTYL